MRTTLWRAGRDAVLETECRQALESLRWPTGLVCPRCDRRRIHKFHSLNRRRKRRTLYQCRDCGFQYSSTAGSIMHNSHLPLVKWFIAIYLINRGGTSIKASLLSTQLELPYKTAWSLLRRIREFQAYEAQLFDDGSIAAGETGSGIRALGAFRLPVIAERFGRMVPSWLKEVLDRESDSLQR